ncbi:hypothetical protein K438DRAFT_1872237 [Mycena galopus ATCC 62051]|nr:hypothetical protein K438DRAFT_1872237 [Mycena galopus ATCC 62051]
MSPQAAGLLFCIVVKWIFNSILSMTFAAFSSVMVHSFQMVLRAVFLRAWIILGWFSIRARIKGAWEEKFSADDTDIGHSNCQSTHLPPLQVPPSRTTMDGGGRCVPANPDIS